MRIFCLTLAAVALVGGTSTASAEKIWRKNAYGSYQQVDRATDYASCMRAGDKLSYTKESSHGFCAQHFPVASGGSKPRTR